MCQSSRQLRTCRAALPSGSFHPENPDTFLLQAKSPGWGEMWEQTAALDASKELLNHTAPVQHWGGAAVAELMGRWQTLAHCAESGRAGLCLGRSLRWKPGCRTTGFKETWSRGIRKKNCPSVLARGVQFSPTARAFVFGLLVLSSLLRELHLLAFSCLRSDPFTDDCPACVREFLKRVRAVRRAVPRSVALLGCPGAAHGCLWGSTAPISQQGTRE